MILCWGRKRLLLQPECTTYCLTNVEMPDSILQWHTQILTLVIRFLEVGVNFFQTAEEHPIWFSRRLCANPQTGISKPWFWHRAVHRKQIWAASPLGGLGAVYSCHWQRFAIPHAMSSLTCGKAGEVISNYTSGKGLTWAHTSKSRERATLFRAV